MSSCATPRIVTRNPPGDCHPSKGSLQSLEEVVQDYIDRRRPSAEEELKYFRDQPNLPAAIRVAALAINKGGERHSHQRRIPGDMLKHFRRGLSAKRKVLPNCKTFPELMKISEKVAGGIWRKPGLTVYDTTHRIGVYLGLEPDRVYLHTGTRDGARAMGLKSSVSYIFPNEFPKAFRRLKPYEIENCLCIYKDDLRLLRNRLA
jgi:hypothetical protein